MEKEGGGNLSKTRWPILEVSKLERWSESERRAGDEEERRGRGEEKKVVYKYPPPPALGSGRASERARESPEGRWEGVRRENGRYRTRSAETGTSIDGQPKSAKRDVRRETKTKVSKPKRKWSGRRYRTVEAGPRPK